MTGVAAGMATITASAGEASGSSVVTVTQSVASVEVSPSAQTIALGSTLQLTAEAFDESGHAVAEVEFAWETSDATVATVDASGLVTGVAVGVATITASAGSAQGTAEITVQNPLASPDREILVALYNATDGPNWGYAFNWLTDAPLGDWSGVETNALGRVTELNLADNDLTGPIPTELGNLTGLERLDLYANRLTGPIPIELGRLADLESLYLSYNDLTGPIPAELGELASLTDLLLGPNSLTGPIPESFLDLEALERFHFEGNADLCAPGTIDFVTWLEGIEDISGPYCNESDAGVLNLLYESSGGPDWTNSSGWLETPALDEWYGVTADALGRVLTLDLSRNGLAGHLPGNLSELAHMTELRIAHNTDLSGRLPLSLADLSLRALHYAGTELCAPVDTSFRDWLSAIPSHEGTSAECGPLSDRENLEILFEATGGPNWTNNENWRTDAPLGDWYGIEVDDQGRVIDLDLRENGLRGRMPRELGNLINLERLDLAKNDLEGSIPPELGSLADLTRLYLRDNQLTGAIPPELGNLAYLRSLRLERNLLTGRIPPKLGDLGNLRTLYLGRNDLTGPIPAELGRLAELDRLNLAANRLTGPIPTRLGRLANLELLYLGENELAGPVPPEFGGLMRLRSLALQTNADMFGVLPASLTNLAALETFQTSGTALCAPSDAGFLEWLQGVPNRRVALCEDEPAVAYLVQAVQSREFPVPLVAGEEALLRVFVTADHDNDERFPPVRASFHLNGALAHVADIAGRPGPIPTEVDEGSLTTSANAVIPANVVQPGLEMVVEVDPDGTLDPALGMARRLPGEGRLAVDVRAMPVLDLTVIPFLWTAKPDYEILPLVKGMAEDPEGHALLEETRVLLPVGELDVQAHEPVLTTTNDTSELIVKAAAIKVIEGGTGRYVAMISGPFTGPAGRGGVQRGAVVSIPRSDVLAHELGHNMSLEHAPCGGASGPDPGFPYPDGTIGAWGYDFRNGRLVPSSWFDLMGYCGPPDWVSDYHFTKALHFRLFFDEHPSLMAILTAQEAASLLLWGGTDAEGEPFLNPAFVVDAPPAPPDATGEHRITGRTADGDELFSLDFAMPETADGDGSASFAFVLPVEPDWAGNLASITLSGPGGSATLDGDTDLPMTILLDPVTGQVRAILRDTPQADAAARAPQANLDRRDTLFSRGIPDASAWGR